MCFLVNMLITSGWQFLAAGGQTLPTLLEADLISRLRHMTGNSGKNINFVMSGEIMFLQIKNVFEKGENNPLMVKILS